MRSKGKYILSLTKIKELFRFFNNYEQMKRGI